MKRPLKKDFIEDDVFIMLEYIEALELYVDFLESGGRDKGKKIPPKLEDVAAYIETYVTENPKKVFESTPEKWFDFYQGKGWMIGKNKMKDWKAAVRTWMKDSPQRLRASRGNVYNDLKYQNGGE